MLQYDNIHNIFFRQADEILAEENQVYTRLNSQLVDLAQAVGQLHGR